MEQAPTARVECADVVVDIGGTKVLVVLASAGAIVGETFFLMSDFDSPDELVAHIATSAQQLATTHAFQLRRGIAAVPGTIDRASGTVVRAANLGFRDYPLAARLSQNLGGVPFEIDDDANCGVIGEATFGAARGSRDVLYITISTGIGMGAIVQGVPVLGSKGSAAELGHVEVIAGGRMCGCGRRGCIEAYASGLAIGAMGSELLSKEGHSLLRSLAAHDDRVTAKEVVEAAELGDIGSKDIVEQAYGHIVKAARMLQVIFDPEVIVFGGGLMSSSFFAEGLMSALHETEPSIDARRAELPERSVILGGMQLVLAASAQAHGDEGRAV
jgi:glucokinase